MITTNTENSPKFKKGILTTHDLPASGPVAAKKLTVVTTSDFDIKGKLKDTARKWIEGGEGDVEKKAEGQK